MKRTNLVLDEHVLAEATRLAGQKTYSATVNAALNDFVTRMRARQILSLRGSGIWQGNLAEMRGDAAGPARTGRRGARP
jgi:Arc/MetJ family transcription regulator